ncbi:uncharacterized protein [Aegilops tauschii subsp. strangulata]|uniref:uncharacterized protein n=1 Tax=Aegilops tauschii subsp. strangulata TaxID=200361 RepID=UPI003CC8C567
MHYGALHSPVPCSHGIRCSLSPEPVTPLPLPFCTALLSPWPHHLHLPLPLRSAMDRPPPLRAPATSNPLLTPSALANSTRGGALFPREPDSTSSAAMAALASPLAGIFINQHVPLVLTLTPPNYTQWRTLFEVMFAKSGVTDHIVDPPRAAAPYWLQDDAHIVSWLYNRVSPEIFGLVHQRNATAAQLWASIATLFLENAEHQAVFLATEFRRIEQGSSSVIAYFARLKDCADRLADLGEPVTDRDQVLNMFRGLAPRLHYAIPILTMQRPLPTFLACRAFLLLEESRHAAQGAGSTDMALHAARSPASGGLGGSSSGGGGRSNNNNSGGGRYKGKGKAPANYGGGSGGNSGGGSYHNTSSSRPPTPSSAPWTGMVHAWAMPWRPHAPGSGILGARPDAPPPFVGTAADYPTAPPYGSPAPYASAPPYGSPAPYASAPPYNAPAAPSWDQKALIHALNSMSMQEPAPPTSAGSEWYLDTGATSHMASSSGTAHKEGDPPM